MNELSTFKFLSHLRHLDITISTNGDKLLCQAPDGILTDELRQEIAKRKPEIITFLDRLNRANNSQLPPIKPISRDRDIPLSFAQKRLWFLDRIEPNNTAYNIPAVLELTGYLNVEALEKAVLKIVDRHEILRTNFTIKNNLPIQVIASHSLVEMKQINTSDTEVKEVIATEINRAFDLETEALLRVTLLTLEHNHRILLVNMHHIIADGWSLQIFLQELSFFYQAFIEQKSSLLAELSIQYADYAYWQQQYLTQTTLKNQLDYWRSHLADAPPLLELPTAKPRPPIQTWNGATYYFNLERSLTQKLNNLSRDSKVTLFMTMLAAFVVLMSRYSGEEDIVIGTPSDNRNRQEISSLIGFFVNTLPLRFQLQNNHTFSEFLTEVQKIVLQARANSDVPFEQIVEALQPQRSLSYSPLFQVLFVWQNAPIEKLELGNLTLTPQVTEINTAKFDLIINLTETNSEMIGWWEYNTDLFDEIVIARMTQNFQFLLNSIVIAPEKSIFEFSLVNSEEHNRLLMLANHSLVTDLKTQCIHEMFEAQVQKTPHALAVIDEEEHFTYEELNNLANQLAHYLQKLDIKPEIPVGIYTKRSLEMLVAIWGILKAGGAYVPLDLSLPLERITHIFKDSQISIVITQNSLVDRLADFDSLKLICQENFKNESIDNLQTKVENNNLAYIIYTSGSTGLPKGVEIEHRALVNYVSWAIEEYLEDNQKYTFPLFSSLSFDLTVTSIFVPLVTGGKIVVYRETEDKIDLSIKRIFKDNAIDIIKATPSHLSLIQDLDLSSSRIKKIIVGGEDLKTSLAKNIYNAFGKNIKIYNEYGPTEATVGCMTYCFNSDKDNRSSVPIGKPAARSQIYLLDYYLNLVPEGVVGEIYIGGLGLARGYVNNSCLTEERFLANPIPPFPLNKDGLRGDRLYKTGDLACYLSDGNIEYLGRVDNQVKVRGFRIELSEIENQLLKYTANLNFAIANAIVIPKNNLDNEQLVAYIIPTDKPPNIVELRKFLKTKLPDYMIPSAYVMLEEFPLTPNGKIDLKALPNPEYTRLVEVDYVIPQTETEKLIAEVWQSVLGIEKVGIYDNFFDLGGHSLMMAQVVAQLSDIFGEKLSILDLFQEPTINALAKYLNQKNHSATKTHEDRGEVRKSHQDLLMQQRQTRRKYRQK